MQEPARQLPTVGDTMTVVQRVSAPPGALVQPRGPEDSLLATLVGVPRVEREGDSVRIAYTLAVWAPGSHALRLPGALVIAPGGTVDTLADMTVQLRVASVLPEGAKPDSLAPESARPWIPRAERSGWPFLAVLLPLVLLFGLVAWWWRRRGPELPRAVQPGLSRADHVTLLERWLAAGEAGLVLDHLATLLPDEPATAEWRTEVAAVRFAADRSGDLPELAREGLARLQRSP